MSEDFNSLGTATTPPLSWLIGNYDANINDAAGPSSGHSVTNDSMTVDDGTHYIKGHTYNYGTTGDSDRALGSIATTTPGDFAVQVGLKNDTGASITQLKIAYTGEQWNRSGQRNGDKGIGYTLWISSSNGGNYTSLGSNLDFYLPQNDGASTSLDGNAAANRESFDITVDLATIGYGSIADGGEFYITWHDRNNYRNDHGIALDDVTITAVPEPSSAALLGFAGLSLILRRRK
jgi:hypothetical protein